MVTTADSTSERQELAHGAQNLLFGAKDLTFGVPDIGIVPDNLNRMPTPLIYEFAFGSELVRQGDRVYALDFGLPTPQTPEQIIVRAAYDIQIPAYAVYQPGGKPVLPSIVFQSTGVAETETLSRGNLELQDFQIVVRAKLYNDVVSITDRYFYSLRDVAGSRYNGISGQWNDDFLPALGYRERTFSVTLRR